MQFAVVSLGIILMVLGAFNLLRYKRQKKGWLKLNAIVLFNKTTELKGMDGSKTVYYSPVLGFIMDGKQYTIHHTEEHAHTALYDEGEKIIIYMNPKDHSRFVIDEVASQVWVPCIMMVGGIGLVIFSPYFSA